MGFFKQKMYPATVKTILLKTSAAMLVFIMSSGATTTHGTYPEPEVCIDNLENTVRFLTTMNPPRRYDHPESLQKTTAYLSRKFKEYGLSPTEQEYIVDGKPYVNIIASAGPREGARLIVGAHYDVYDDLPGADDNASGIAGLLEVARFAKEHESELPYRVDFVAYTLEEPPFFSSAHMGSYVHAESLHKDNVKVNGMICLEMIGFFTDANHSQRYPLPFMRLFYPHTGNFIAVVSNFGSSALTRQVAENLQATSIPVATLTAPKFVLGIDFSDHRNYWKFGYDAVMVTDTSFYRNPNYHKKTDTIETLDFKRMQEVVKGICWSIIKIK
jgi:hypothetical protein